MKNKILILPVTIILILCLILFPNKSYASNSSAFGYGWSNRPITVYASNTLSAFELSQLQQAIATWNTTSFGTFFNYGGTLPVYSILTIQGAIGITKDSFPSGSTTRCSDLSSR